jgi:hypothetical protein
MASPLFMRDVTLTLKLVTGGTGTRAEFNCDLHTAEIVPSPGDDVTYQTLCPDGTHSQVGATTYALHIVAGQQWAADGLAAFLWINDGESAEFQYQAHGEGVVPSADAPGMSGIVRLIAGNYGGEADNYAELDVTLPCTSKPVMVTGAFPAVAAEEAGETVAA